MWMIWLPNIVISCHSVVRSDVLFTAGLRKKGRMNTTLQTGGTRRQGSQVPSHSRFRSCVIMKSGWEHWVLGR
ncbi:hypothetical protein QBC43DRAFT_320850 [Cladorrhinum sp. PSN259]|nr:hypothetical protein QBC43DRAFT_320850 [Cladorrhinum sp. PSN259]